MLNPEAVVNDHSADGAAQVRSRKARDIFAAVDLGTNNCRLLIARADGSGSFRVVDAFSRSVRLGEGVRGTGLLSPTAVDRTIAALKVCASKIRRSGATYSRAIATEACRAASNSAAFIRRVEVETGLRMEIVAPGEEARLCAQGCAPLTDPGLEDSVLFDIGGGSTELIWMRRTPARAEVRPRMAGWASIPMGVVNLADHFGAFPLKESDYPAMVAYADAAFAKAMAEQNFTGPNDGRPMHLLGTSGTVTTLAGVHLDLPRYDRKRIDGQWLTVRDVQAITQALTSQTFAMRAAHPCIGTDRADLLLPGCAILTAILSRYPCERIRIADRGLREGILLSLMAKAEKDRQRSRKKYQRTGLGTA